MLFTQDPDFLRLRGAGVQQAGIVYARQGTPIGDIIRGLILIHQVLEPEEMNEGLRGALVIAGWPAQQRHEPGGHFCGRRLCRALIKTTGGREAAALSEK